MARKTTEAKQQLHTQINECTTNL